MSFSSEVKEELSVFNNFNKEILIAELIGYIFSGNTIEKKEYLQFITENEFNIEHLYKLLFNLGLDYEPEIKGKCYIATIIKNEKLQQIMMKYNSIKKEFKKYIIKGAFLGAGSVNNPDKNYHLEITFINKEYKDKIIDLCNSYGVNFKFIAVNEKYQIYLKEADEISSFLALIGTNKAVLKFEDIRVIKDMKNNINRKVNCEAANLNKTIDAALKQIDDINKIKKAKKFELLPNDLKEVANLRLENIDLSLQDIGKLLSNPVGKSGVNHRFKKIHEIAEELN